MLNLAQKKMSIAKLFAKVFGEDIFEKYKQSSIRKPVVGIAEESTENEDTEDGEKATISSQATRSDEKKSLDEMSLAE